MIIRMTTPARPQQRYDHRLRHLVQRTKDVTIATDFGVPSLDGPWVARQGPEVVVSLDVTDMTVSLANSQLGYKHPRKNSPLVSFGSNRSGTHGYGMRCSSSVRRLAHHIDRARGVQIVSDVWERWPDGLFGSHNRFLASFTRLSASLIRIGLPEHLL